MSNQVQKLTKMIPIPVTEFVSGTAIPIDIYIKLNADKYLCVARKGDKTQLKNLSAIREKNMTHIYVEQESYGKFVQQTLEILEIATQNQQFRNEHRTFFLRNAVTAVFNEIEQSGFSLQTMVNAKEISQSTILLVANQPRLSEILKGLQSASASVFNLSVATSVFSVMIAQRMGWNSRPNIEKLALGGLLAEIGLKELPPELVHKPRLEMTHDEVMRYEEHPYRGMRMLENVGAVPSDVLSIVFEHHENAMGMGYPRRLRELRINPLAKVVALATQFCELIVANPCNPEPRSMKEALRYMELVMGQPYNREAFQALKSLIEEELSSATSAAGIGFPAQKRYKS